MKRRRDFYAEHPVDGEHTWNRLTRISRRNERRGCNSGLLCKLLLCSFQRIQRGPWGGGRRGQENYHRWWNHQPLDRVLWSGQVCGFFGFFFFVHNCTSQAADFLYSGSIFCLTDLCAHINIFLELFQIFSDLSKKGQRMPFFVDDCLYLFTFICQ